MTPSSDSPKPNKTAIPSPLEEGSKAKQQRNIGKHIVSLLWPLPLAGQILLGLALGIIIGLVFGPSAQWLEPIGRGFILLLQMNVLPYIALSLVVSIGSLNHQQAKTIAKYGGSFLLVLWLFSLLVIFFAPLAFPDWPAASYFSTKLLEEQQSLDLIDYLIPANPFQALAEKTVPAIVIFSSALGAALIGVAEKRPLLKNLDTAVTALGRIHLYVMKLAPIGVLAIAANAVGSLETEQLKGLSIYLISSLIMSLLLVFWWLPGLIRTLTPLRYGAVFKSARSALLTAFVTGNLFLVLPLIVERAKALFKEQLKDNDPRNNDAEAVIDVLVPISYSLPTTGKLLTLIFVLFAGWFTGFSIPAEDYFALAIAGLSNLFISPSAALPSLLNQFQIPQDTFDLFLLADNLLIGRLGALLGAMFTLVLTLLATSAALGWLRFKWYRLARYMIISAILTSGCLYGSKLLFETFSHQYQGYKQFIQRERLFEGATISLKAQPDSPLPSAYSHLSVLDRIQTRGFLRVGYFRDWLPYAFRNQNGDLVGLDVEIAQQLASDLGVNVEFVLVYRNQVQNLLNSGYLDMASSVALTPESIRKMTLSNAYMDEHMAFVVKDYQRENFTDWQKIKSIKNLRIGVPDTYYQAAEIKQLLPNATVFEIASPRLFFKPEKHDLDAMVFGAAGASAWSLIEPSYTVVTPRPLQRPIPLVYPLAGDDTQWIIYMHNWLELKQHDGTIGQLYDYWIKGKEPDIEY